MQERARPPGSGARQSTPGRLHHALEQAPSRDRSRPRGPACASRGRRLGEQRGEVVVLVAPALRRRASPPARARAARRADRRVRTRRAPRRGARGRRCAAPRRAGPGSSSGRITLRSSLSGFSIASGSTSPSRSRASVSRRGEAVRDRLEQAAVAQQVLEPAPQRLAAGEPADRLAARGQRRRAACRARGCARPPRSGRPRAGRRCRARAAPQPARRPVAARTRAARGCPFAVSSSMRSPSSFSIRSARSGTTRGSAGLGYTSIVPGTKRAPHSSTISRAASRCARSPARGAAASRSAPTPRCAARAPSRSA